MRTQLFFGLLATSEAVLLAWSREDLGWCLPRETMGVDATEAEPTRMPVPTAPAELRKRDDEVCGYISGRATSTFGCQNGARCFSATNSVLQHSFIDCCISTDINSCTPATTCLDRTDSSLMGSTSTRKTQLCSSSEYPHCVTYSYGPGSYSGYTWYACGASNYVRTVFAEPTDAPLSTRRTSATTTGSNTRNSPTLGSAPTDSQFSGDGPNTGNSSGPNIPAIVGGVVGGLAFIGLVVAVILFIFVYKRRQSRKTTSTYGAPLGAPSMTQSTPPPGGPPIMYGPPGAAGVDPRNSTMKYGPDATQTPRESYYGSPPLTQPGSPNSGYGYPPPMGGQFAPVPAPTGSPAPFHSPQGQSPPGQHSPWQPPQGPPPAQWQPPPGQTHGAPASELPLTRGDPQLREMQ